MVISFVWNANPARAYKMTFLGTKLPCNPETHTGLIEIAVFPLHLCEVVSQLFHYRKIEKHNSIIKQIMNKARGHLHRIGKYCWIVHGTFISSKESVPPHEQMTKVVFE